MIRDIDSFASAHAKEVDDMARGIEHRIDSMSEESYNQNESMIEDVRDNISKLNDIIYKKQSAIERLCYGLTQLEESISESEGEYGIYLKKAFSDIKTIDI